LFVTKIGDAQLSLTVVFDTIALNGNKTGSMSPTFEFRIGDVIFYLNTTVRADRSVRLVSNSRFLKAYTPEDIIYQHQLPSNEKSLKLSVSI
jgi:signal peptidase I